MTKPTRLTWTDLTALVVSTQEMTVDLVDDTGAPYQLVLDEEHREALGMILVDPPGADIDEDDDLERARLRDDSECDGTTHRNTRNCEETAVWELYIPDESGEPSQACGQHLHQVATYLLDGEQGDLDIRRIRTTER